MIFDHCRVTVQRFFFKICPYCLKRTKNVVWQSTDGRVTSDHCRETVQRLLSKNFLIAWNVQKRCLTVGRRSRDLRPLSRDRSVTLFKFVLIAWNVEKTLFDSGPTVAELPTTVAWPFSDFFQEFSKLLVTSKNVVWQSADGRVTSDLCRVSVVQLFSNFFSIVWIVGKTLVESQRTVAWLSGYFAPVFVSYSFTYASVCCLSLVLIPSFRQTAWPRISSYRNGPILEILTSYQS